MGFRSLPRRVLPLGILLGAAVLLVLAQPVHAWLLSLFDRAGALISQRSTEGMVVFVLLAALSAMMAFVSSAVLVPVAIHVWGPTVCFFLLWIGWFIGGLAGYAIGRYLGRPAVLRLVHPDALMRYEGWARSGKTLVPMLTVQLAIPSDLASYLFGLVRCRFTIFAAALALAEIPYALGAVYLGASFLERQLLPLAALGIAGILVSVWAIRRLHRVQLPKTEISTPPGPGPAALPPLPENQG